MFVMGPTHRLGRLSRVWLSRFDFAEHAMDAWLEATWCLCAWVAWLYARPAWPIAMARLAQRRAVGKHHGCQNICPSSLAETAAREQIGATMVQSNSTRIVLYFATPRPELEFAPQ